jgi:hypothetical protein
MIVLVCTLAAAGCAHRGGGARASSATSSMAPIGQTHEPYRGKPAYLVAARPF